MEIIVAIALIWGTVKAAETAGEWAAKWAKSAATKQWRVYASKHPHPKTGRAGRAVGRTVSAGFHGGVAAGRGTVAGWREGWPEGKAAGRSWWEQRTTRKTADTGNVTALPDRTVDPERPAGTPVAVRPARDRIPSRQTIGSSALADPGMVEMGAMPPPDTINGYRDGQAVIDRRDGTPGRVRFMKLTPDELAETGPRAEVVHGDGLTATELSLAAPHLQPADTGPDGLATVHPIGGDNMSITTATGGEVTTFEALIDELASIEKEAVGDLDDATGDAQRAREDAARVETMHASLAALDLDEQTLADIAALLDDSGQRLKAAEARQAAAESRAAHAQVASAGVLRRHQQMQEAHDATPHAADKAFYTH